MEPKIKLEHVSKEFNARRSNIRALDDINLEIFPSEFISLVGPSGCGKSTIIRMVDDIIKPTSGTIIVDGKAYDNSIPISKQDIMKLGFIFQIPNLYPWLTIKEHLYLPLKVYGEYDEPHMKYADELLDMIHLSDYADAYPKEISGGMAQRIGVIRGMVHKPEMLMMDEPFGALDDDTREELDLEIRENRKNTGITIIFITHNINEAVLISDRVVVLKSHPGQIKDEVKIDLPYDRTLDMQESHEFLSYAKKIQDLIGTVDIKDIV